MDSRKTNSEMKTVALFEATTSLAANLAQSEPFIRYRAAEQKMRADPEAAQLLSDLSSLQERVRQEQRSGLFSEEHIQQLSILRTIVGTNESIQDYLLAQELAIAELREVNQEISQVLNVDFASLARRSGCC